MEMLHKIECSTKRRVVEQSEKIILFYAEIMLFNEKRDLILYYNGILLILQIESCLTLIFYIMKNLKLSFIFLTLVFLGSSITVCQAKRHQPKAKAKHVVLIGIDGWAAKSIADADMPCVKGTLMANGSYTLKKRSVLPSASAINWASVFMGVGTESHGYTKWFSKVPEIPSSVTNERGIFPTIYSILKEQRPEARSGLLCDWDVIKHLVDSACVDDVMFIPGGSSGDEYVEKHGGTKFDYTMAAVNYIKEKKPTFMTIYFSGLDHAGHTFGWYTDEYYAFEKFIDQCVKLIVDATKEAGIYDDTIFVLTADHGGIDKGHVGMTLDEMLSPFVVCGKGIKEGFVMTDAMMQYDVPATVAYMLGVTPPQAWVGRPMTSIFKK